MSSSVPSRRFYVYVLARPDGRVFYVGKGQKDRIYQHDTEARSGHKCHKCNVIRKIWSTGDTVGRVIVYETDNEMAALDCEIFQIAEYGRKNLTNMTTGGDGVPGYWDIPGTREAQRERTLAMRQRPEYMAKQAEAMRRLHADPSFRVKIAAATKLGKQTDEAKRRQSAAQRKRFEDLTARATHRNIMIMTHGDPERRATRSIAQKAKWQDPAYRESIMASRSTPEAKARRTTGLKGAWERRRTENPEALEAFRAKQREGALAAAARRKATKEQDKT